MDVEDFIRRWSDAPISERAHYQTFISQLCRLIGVGAPDDDRAGDIDYCFERPVRFLHEDGSSHPGYIDCYRRGAFVLEAKQSGKRAAGGALLQALRSEGLPVGPAALASRFSGRSGRRTEDRIAQTLAVLAVAGTVQRTEHGWFAPRRS
ncbi:type IIL restriction-modification enzyme MmeI [Brevundimonas vesicularis]|uniref:type IIL restriction-modification enzyme MmeI n=1 Tax=Brevundimonas vesicularis TaxID=41276 RepID=UPI0038D3BE29